VSAALDLALDPAVVAMDHRRGHAFPPPAAVLDAIPALRSTDGQGFAALVHVHYFCGGWDWWVTEIDPGTLEAFGFVRSHMCPDGEWGYLDLLELATTLGAQMQVGDAVFRAPVERDLYWQRRPLSEVLA
jgi:hypothetical protein